jgi:hypothetical protein
MMLKAAALIISGEPEGSGIWDTGTSISNAASIYPTRPSLFDNQDRLKNI